MVSVFQLKSLKKNYDPFLIKINEFSKFKFFGGYLNYPQSINLQHVIHFTPFAIKNEEIKVLFVLHILSFRHMRGPFFQF